MTLPLLLSGLGLLATPACARPMARRLPPSEWAKAGAAMLATGAVVVEASLALQAAPFVLRAAGLEGVAELCEHALGPVAPGGVPLGIAAAHGLIAALSHEELAVVLRHEVAHVHHRHQRYLLLARVVEGSLGLLPLVRRATAAVRCAVERWADEAAAGGDSADRASLHAALLRLAELAAMPEVAAFTTPGTVAERLEALTADPTCGRAVARRALVYVPAGLLLVAAVVALGGILEHVTVLHMLAGLCPPH